MLDHDSLYSAFLGICAIAFRMSYVTYVMPNAGECSSIFIMASGATTAAQPAGQKPKPKSQEQIIAGFQELRQQQRAVASKINELEMDMKEHE